MPDTNTHALRKRVRGVREQAGHGTELVSLYIPPENTLRSVRDRIAKEHAEAENIKSDRTRQHVQSALARVKRVLKQYDSTPENGLVVFAGHIDGTLVDYVFDNLPEPVTQSLYRCSNEFNTDELESLVTATSRYGLLVLDRNDATVGGLVGERVEVYEELESNVMGKTRAGGQSAQRFARERERQKHEFFTTVATRARETLIGDDQSLDGLVIGGTTITVEEFTNGDYLDYRLRDALLGTFGVEYGTAQGLHQLVDKAASTLADADGREAREAMDEFFTGLAGDEPVTYGEEGVETALEYGAVDRLLVSSALSTDTIHDWEASADEIGAEILVVSDEFDRGTQLRDAFGGVAALLRYPIE